MVPSIHHKFVRIKFANNQIIETFRAGTKDEILDYYHKGRVFNLGKETDNHQAITEVKILPEIQIKITMSGGRVRTWNVPENCVVKVFDETFDENNHMVKTTPEGNLFIELRESGQI